MPETRYIETYEQGTGKLLSKTPYVVSDEELAEEARRERMANILDELDDLQRRVRDLERSRSSL